MADRAELERRTRELESQAISNYIDRMKRGQEQRAIMERARELRPSSRDASIESLGRTMQRSVLANVLSKSKERKTRSISQSNGALNKMIYQRSPGAANHTQAFHQALTKVYSRPQKEWKTTSRTDSLSGFNIEK